MGRMPHLEALPRSPRRARPVRATGAEGRERAERSPGWAHAPSPRRSAPLPSNLAGVTVVYAGYDVDDHGSSAVTPGSGGALVPVPGDDGHPRSVAPVPTAFYARPMTVDHDLWLGLALTSPWGLGVEYNDDWFGRYDSIETRLTTVNFSPALAYRRSAPSAGARRSPTSTGSRRWRTAASGSPATSPRRSPRARMP